MNLFHKLHLIESTLSNDIAEHHALADLMDLWEEGHTADDEDEFVSPSPLSVTGVSFPPLQAFKPKSRNFPLLNTNPNIWAFVQQVCQTIEKHSFGPFSTSNLTSSQCKAIKSLQTNPHIVIKPADKGGNLVILNVDQYETMCKKILDNTDWYRPISKTVLENFYVKYRSIISKALFQGIINKDTWKNLNTRDPRIPTFYALPKTHKSFTA